MAWNGFDGRAYTRAEFAAHVDRCAPYMDWAKGLTLHNTAAPRLDQWAESGPKHDARIRNLQHYYETQLGWHAGPHLFISRNYINGFSDLTKPGVHSRCFNGTHIGIEMVGDYAVESFDSGDGAMVRDNAVFAMAALCKALGLDPDDLTFHRDCTRDNHACPGKLVVKSEVIARVKALMAGTGYTPPATPIDPWDLPPFADLRAPASARMAWAQDRMNKALRDLRSIPVDGLIGPLTRNYLSLFQKREGLPMTERLDTATLNRLKEKYA